MDLCGGESKTAWVDENAGTVSREVFVADDIFRLEMDRIFYRSWVFLCHETEIPNTGDFVVRSLGSAQVVVARDENGQIHALLNSCRHRGAQVCRMILERPPLCLPLSRVDIRALWRVGHNHFRPAFPTRLQVLRFKLAQSSTIGVLTRACVFGCWKSDVDNLADYLGDFAWYLDPFLARSPLGMEVLSSPHRWRTRCNWKVGALNFVGDFRSTF